MNQFPEPLHRGQKLNWNYPLNLIGEKVTDPVIHSCELCDLPILIYGRVLPCKHVFCHDCSSKAEKNCPRCKDPVSRIERCELGTIFLCTWGAPRHSQEGCRRTYLSQRDLQAHVNHRHAQQKPSSVSSLSNPSISNSSTSGIVNLPNVPQQRRDNVGSVNSPANPLEQSQMAMQQAPSQPWQQQQQPPRQGTRGNLITIQLQGDNTRLERRNPSQRPVYR